MKLPRDGFTPEDVARVLFPESSKVAERASHSSESPPWLLEDEEAGWVRADCSLIHMLLQRLDAWTDRVVAAHTRSSAS